MFFDNKKHCNFPLAENPIKSIAAIKKNILMFHESSCINFKIVTREKISCKKYNIFPFNKIPNTFKTEFFV